ncbi:hypothetical protein CVV26_01245 [Candidatus Kuenenbacteria bacterium HGW-Kuenenbacteria-1]|uniref:Uncharacterized protein n=1 Tax=Candidatus Kuenenbacteria bacterium HGW-Kuenenbacteria-1 TaxID=2013812 RepID=A0A2N1UNR8_9BACT|nr:MAG: hypothetical protein CVV26_01245 [Candidatus Kuenenbacteria bacterium HGW-Kuenenbacteria-1]
MIQPSISLNEQIKKLQEENLEYSKEILKLNKKIYSYIFWEKIFGVIKMALIIIPIIITLIYLPKLLEEYFVPYQELFRQAIGISKQENKEVQIQDIQKLLTPEQLDGILKKIPNKK